MTSAPTSDVPEPQTAEPSAHSLSRQSEFSLDEAVAERSAERNGDISEDLSVSPDQGSVSEEVVAEIAGRALTQLADVRPVPAPTVLPLQLSQRRPQDAVKVNLKEKPRARIALDAYISVRWGVRIPDLAWDVQEYLKQETESATGYDVESVNVHVQSIFFPSADAEALSAAASAVENASDSER